MSPAELVDRARAAGLMLEPRGDRLRVRGPKPLPRNLLDDLRRNKAEVLAHLRQRRSTNGIGCARPPDRTCPSCSGGLQPEDQDEVLCGTCRYTVEYLSPSRVQ